MNGAPTRGHRVSHRRVRVGLLDGAGHAQEDADAQRDISWAPRGETAAMRLSLAALERCGEGELKKTTTSQLLRRALYSEPVGKESGEHAGECEELQDQEVRTRHGTRWRREKWRGRAREL